MVSTPQRQTVSEKQSRRLAEESRQGWEKPSFAKELYLGHLRLDLVHPEPAASPLEQARGEAFLSRLREYCATLDPTVIEREGRVPDTYVKGLAELGCFGIKIPERHGGLGLGQLTYNRALMLVGSVHSTLAVLLSAHQSIGVPEPLKLAGTPAQQDAYLPRCAAGAVSAFLLTEPDVGSDPAHLATTAVPTEDGSAYEIDGVKLWTTNGVVAELLVVMARVPESQGHRGGVTAFVVEADSPGITVERRNGFMGLRGIENGVTRFHRVRVPKENVIGGEGQGLKIALATLNTGRLSVPACCAGAAKWALSIARQWSAERVQWGRPIAEHEAIAARISFIAATAFALESVVELTSRLADAGGNDIRIEAALAKLWASELAWQVADDLVQIRGGRGYETAESLAARGERAVPAEQLLRDLRINRIFEGSTEIMHLLIAREAVDTHLAVAGDLAEEDADLRAKARAAVGASGFYAGWLPRLLVGAGLNPASFTEFGALAPHLRFVERRARKLARATFYGMARWQARLQRRQGFLGRVVDIGAELFAMSATCVRAAALRGEDEEQGRTAERLADTFCRQSRLRVERLFDALWTNTDDEDRELAGSVLRGDITWLEAGILDPSEGTGPWIARSRSGASTEPNLARRYEL
ncbi:acyl-CoA dehydrogenase family protein [Saccharomonospora xinjiangensis]|uniref:acyl-CoA dehydrogenase family protein n=3 Tax=Saccharomonospora xinjiangensis TaxID=75294 RepID=UPI0010700215|nr:acyl-CoA dehydrogenase family protein [Saccharomonospora xinjiangensis]QBQ59506.1 Acyl-CoA dehydrogenase [Saccharomonospora xinjiangensis]